MSDNQELNEFGQVPDSPEAYQAAAVAEGQPDPLDPSTVPTPPVDDIGGETPAGEVPPAAPEVPPAPQPEPAAPAAASAEDKVAAGRSSIPGLKEDPDTLGLEGVALETKIKLSKEPKVRMMIPFDPGERAGAYRTVVINGYRFDVKKNVMVDLPESVASLLAKSYRITSEVVDQHENNLANADAGTRSALGV